MNIQIENTPTDGIDEFYTWLSNNYNIRIIHRKTTKEVYNYFVEWCNGKTDVTQKVFSTRFHKLLPHRVILKVQKVNGKPERVYIFK